MLKHLAPLLTLLGLGGPAPEPEIAPEPAPTVDTDRAARAFGPRGTHPRRRSYGLPCAFVLRGEPLEPAHIGAARETKAIEKAARKAMIWRANVDRTALGRYASQRRAQAADVAFRLDRAASEGVPA